METNDSIDGAAGTDAVWRDEVFQSLVGIVETLRPGDRLPAERELATRLGISRIALRDRLQSLQALGILERRVGSGSYVQAVLPETVATVLNLGLIGSGLTIESLQPLRVALERQAAMEAARRAVPGPMAVMATMVKKMRLSDDAQELYDADVAFHRALFDASESPGLIFIAQALASVLARSVEERRARMRRMARDNELMCGLHQDIYDAVLSGDEAAAISAIDRHFQVIDDLNGGDEEP